MTKRIKVADLELSQPLQKIEGLEGYMHLQLLLRWHGHPIGYSKLPVHGDSCSATQIAEAVVVDHSFKILNHLSQVAMRSSVPLTDWQLDELFRFRPHEESMSFPSISVAVCTRDRTEDVALCLSALQKLEFAPLEVLVIDNAPKTNQTKSFVEKQFPNVRYILEPRPGLDWARNRAIIEARGEIIAYTDDDVIVDSLWTKNLAAIFAEDPDVMAVTGLVVPYELETEPQILFEHYGGFGRGFDRKWYRASQSERRHLAREHAGAGKFGTGANMSYRRAIFSEIGKFDLALDVGTVTQGGGDLDMFFRVLKHGHTLVYEPAAIVRHRHRREFAKLQTQIASNGIGLYSCWMRSALTFPEERKGLAQLGLWWFWFWNLRRWLVSLFKPTVFPRELIFAELRGCFAGLLRYQTARENAKLIIKEFGEQLLDLEKASTQPIENSLRDGIAIRTVDIAKGITCITDVSKYFQTRVFVTCNGSALGQAKILNRYCEISASRLANEIANELGIDLVCSSGSESPEIFWSKITTRLRNHLLRSDEIQRSSELPKRDSVSIVIATCDRPNDLRTCLRALAQQRTSRRVEIIVVDNRPASELTPPIVAEFHAVRLISESRPGPSYARNAGFAASTGEIIVTTDDDVIPPPDWLEKLLTPFRRNDVMLVTGNIFPAELETFSQLQFENYGGLGRGFEQREFNRDWFDSFRFKAVPTWEIGATANAAVRASLLSDSSVALFDEAIGPGMPTGCSEDTDFFYRILKAGHTIIYEPTAFVWHKHRVRKSALHKQIYSYSKGHVAYHLTTFLRDGDGRGLVRVFVELPRYQLRQFGQWLTGKHNRSLKTILLEILGNLAGPWALWSARRRVKKFGKSAPYVPVELRAKPKTVRSAIQQFQKDEPAQLNDEMEAAIK